MFQRRINELLQALQLSTSALARYAEIDRTVLSRFRSGTRTPSASSDMIQKIVKGLIRSAEETGQEDRLFEILKVTPDHTENLQEFLFQYLTEKNKDDVQSKESMKSDTNKGNHVFGDRLRKIMTLAEISNVRLSKALNVDASLISRYCSGTRTPRSNPQIMKEMGLLLFERIIAVGKQPDLCKMMKISENELDEIAFSNWLFQTEVEQKSIAEVARKMIYSLDSFSAVPDMIDISLEQIIQQNAEQETHSAYTGIEGLRHACIRLLIKALQSGGRELWLYSDFDLNWMVEDKNFWMQWSLLMAACVQKKIHIHIVHQLNRRMDEILNAISGWLPLYMSGMVDSYYCLTNTSTGFSHVMFICPGVAAIDAFHVIGMEKKGIYRFHEDEKILAFYKESFTEFLINARPLVKILGKENEEMQKASIRITTDGIVLHSETEPDQIIPGKQNEFKNTEILIGDSFAAVKRLKEKQVIFYITHPYMVEAFKVYAQFLMNEQ